MPSRTKTDDTLGDMVRDSLERTISEGHSRNLRIFAYSARPTIFNRSSNRRMGPGLNQYMRLGKVRRRNAAAEMDAGRKALLPARNGEVKRCA
jgi:hypothetical protein